MPPGAKKTHYNVVLGISIKDLKLDVVEAIIIAKHQRFQGSSFVKSEVSVIAMLYRRFFESILRTSSCIHYILYLLSLGYQSSKVQRASFD
jgi:hypothetical protein